MIQRLQMGVFTLRDLADQLGEVQCAYLCMALEGFEA